MKKGAPTFADGRPPATQKVIKDRSAAIATGTAAGQDQIAAGLHCLHNDVGGRSIGGGRADQKSGHGEKSKTLHLHSPVSNIEVANDQAASPAGRGIIDVNLPTGPEVRHRPRPFPLGRLGQHASHCAHWQHQAEQRAGGRTPHRHRAAAIIVAAILMGRHHRPGGHAVFQHELGGSERRIPTGKPKHEDHHKRQQPSGTEVAALGPALGPMCSTSDPHSRHYNELPEPRQLRSSGDEPPNAGLSTDEAAR